MDHADEISNSLSELSRLLVSEATLDTTMARVVSLAKETVEGCDLASVTLVLADGEVETTGATEAAADELDRFQYESNEGPCLDAFRLRRVVPVDLLSAETRWPNFTRLALDRGLRSSISFPLIPRDDVVGALNLYSRSPDAFGVEARDAASLLAAQAAVALSNAQVYQRSVRITEQLREALESRAAIDQAKGMLMEREGITADEAFALLVRTSQESNVKLRDIARKMVEEAGVTKPPEQPPQKGS
jgi:GAF domain-containing protein